MSWATELAAAIRPTHSDDGILLARVAAIAPLSIEISGQVIDRQLYAPPNLAAEPGELLAVWRHGNSFFVLSREAAL